MTFSSVVSRTAVWATNGFCCARATGQSRYLDRVRTHFLRTVIEPFQSTLARWHRWRRDFSPTGWLAYRACCSGPFVGRVTFNIDLQQGLFPRCWLNAVYVAENQFCAVEQLCMFDHKIHQIKNYGRMKQRGGWRILKKSRITTMVERNI